MNSTQSIDSIFFDLQSLRSLSRKQCEVVLTRYKGDLAWTTPITHILSIYDKSPLKLPGAIPAENYGVSEETVLRHIIDRYDSLADVTFFTQQDIGDRKDQPCARVIDYFSIDVRGFHGVESPLKYSPQWRSRYYSASGKSFDVGASVYDLESFSKIVCGITEPFSQRMWVRGSYFSVGSERIRSTPRGYYQRIYKACDFKRGNGIGRYNGGVVEEVYFLERLYWSIFNLDYQLQDL